MKNESTETAVEAERLAHAQDSEDVARAAVVAAEARLTAAREAQAAEAARAADYKAAEAASRAELLTCEPDAVDAILTRARRATENAAVFVDRAAALQPRVDEAAAEVAAAEEVLLERREARAALELEAGDLVIIELARRLEAEATLAATLEAQQARAHELESIRRERALRRLDPGDMVPDFDASTPAMRIASRAEPWGSANQLQRLGAVLRWETVERAKLEAEAAELARRDAALRAPVTRESLNAFNRHQKPDRTVPPIPAAEVDMRAELERMQTVRDTAMIPGRRVGTCVTEE